MNQIIKMLIILQKVFYYASGWVCMYLSQFYKELDNTNLWKAKLIRENLLLLPSVKQLKKYYFVALKVREKTRDVHCVEVYRPLYSLEEEFISDLGFVLSEKASYGIYSLREKKKILCLEMERVLHREQRKREIEQICFNFNLYSEQTKATFVQTEVTSVQEKVIFSQTKATFVQTEVTSVQEKVIFSQAEFGLTIKEAKIYSYLFSSPVQKDEVLFVLCYHGLLENLS